jgi:hypothetical protein
MAAQGSVVFTLGDHPSGADLNIGVTNGATGTTVGGTLTGFPGTTVDFTSTQTLETLTSPSQMVTTAAPGAITNIMISVVQAGHPGQGSFGRLIIDPVITAGSGALGGSTTVSVQTLETLTNTLQTATFTGLTLGTGDNFLTLQVANNEVMLGATLSVPGGFNQLKQTTIAGPLAAGNGFVPVFNPPVTTPDVTTAPEPATFTFIATGLLCAAARRRFRFRKATA